MTQHQAPEVTGEMAPCPFCGRPGDTSNDGSKWCAGCSECYCMVGETFDRSGMPDHVFETEAEAITAWNTRATQPLSLTVDDELIERGRLWQAEMERSRDALTAMDDPSLAQAIVGNTEVAATLKALTDRLQSLSLPDSSLQKAQTSAGWDIDRSGLAQEVE